MGEIYGGWEPTATSHRTPSIVTREQGSKVARCGWWWMGVMWESGAHNLIRTEKQEGNRITGLHQELVKVGIGIEGN